MSLPVMVVLEEDNDAVARIEAELDQRYGRDYRVESRSMPRGPCSC